jgi:hypothetical protein
MSTTSASRSEPRPTASDFRGYSRRIIRIVEAQHRISTDRLVEGPAEQELLERLVEEVKPTMPTAARGLHHLLATPFRYGYSRETRFRRANERPGVFYASEEERTAVAETAYWRMRFFAASPGARLPRTTAEHWAFSIPVRVSRALDLTAEPMVRGRSLWTRPRDYGPCQRLAREARAIDAQLIRYESVRDPQHAANVALFDPGAFRKPVPTDERTWHLRFRGNRLTAFAAGSSDLRYDFTFAQFGLSPP